MAGLNLLALLQAAGGMAPDQLGEDINVIGRKKVPAAPQAPLLAGPVEEDVAPMSLGNREFIEETLHAQKQGKTNSKGKSQRKGMFGIGGTLRDVLGALGDNYLMSKGAKPAYRELRHREDTSDAMAGLGQQDDRAVIGRLAGVDPEMAAALYDKIIDNRTAQMTAQGTANKNSQETYQKGSELFGRFYGSANAESFERVKPILNMIKKKYNLGDAFSIDDEYNPDTAHAYQYGGMPATNQVRDIRTQEAEQGRNQRFEKGESGKMARTQVQQEGANQRDNPPAPEGISAVDARVANAVLSGKATPAQQKYYNDRLKKQTKRSRFEGAAVPKLKTKPATGGKYVVRGGKLVPKDQ